MKLHSSFFLSTPSRFVFLFGLPIYSQSMSQLLLDIKQHVSAKGDHQQNLTIFTPNPEQVMLSKRNTNFLSTLLTGDILVPDGIGLILAGKILLGKDGPRQRIPGRFLVENILDIANEKKLSVFLLGGKGNTSKRLLERLQQTYTQIHFFEHSGFSFVKNPKEAEKTAILQSIKNAHPDIVLVAFGAPYQEEWVSTNKQELQTYGVRLTMVVGGTFDILLGKMPKVPLLLEKLNLEWFWRLILEPKRIKRQIWLPLFFLTILSEKFQDVIAKK